jgi:hypothetical protein
MFVVWPIIPAAVGTLLLANSDAVPITCQSSGVGFDRPIYSTCLRSLFPLTTGPDPILVGLCWLLIAVSIVLALVGWSVFLRRRWLGASSISRIRGLVLLLPVLPAVGVVAFLMGGDGIAHFCGSDLVSTYWPTALPFRTCLPTPFHDLTGSSPTAIWIAWVLVGLMTYVGLLGWALVFASRSNRSKS